MQEKNKKIKMSCSNLKLLNEEDKVNIGEKTEKDREKKINYEQ